MNQVKCILLRRDSVSNRIKRNGNKETSSKLQINV
jgi:hypothetical protein